MNINEIVKERMNNKFYSRYACLNESGYRLIAEEEDFRPIFYRDIDRIIYTLSYIRYIDKTQVFSEIDNDYLQKRIIHVQFVSKIARTIGRALGLNEDLIEAASLGHDLGHVPFGHVGEMILNEISLKNNEGYFNHNVQSVRNLMYIEKYGKGVNVSVQVLDAILCHNGEFYINKLSPIKKTKEDFLNEYNNSYTDSSIVKSLKPMTLEGCVVRVCDIVGYLGRDLEDAKRLKLIKQEDIPKDIINVLGKNNKEIISTIVNDIIENSFDKNEIIMSEKIYDAVCRLKDFNSKNIYYKANNEESINKYKKMFNSLFDVLLYQIENNVDCPIVKSYLKNLSEEYNNNNTKKRIVLDYISGMTDDYFIKQYEKYCLINN